MNKIRKTIHETVSNLEETISWSMPTFKYKKNLIHFAGHKIILEFILEVMQ